MAKGLILVLLFCASTCIASEKLTAATYLDDKIRFGEVGIVKVSPSFFAGWTPRGAILSYETGSGINYWSLHFSLKYFMGVDTSETFSPIDEHFRLELQPRFWVTDFMHGFFFAPILAVYHTGDVAGGLAVGGQFHLSPRLLVDAYAGVQTTTPIENLKDSIFLKFGMNLGFRITK